MTDGRPRTALRSPLDADAILERMRADTESDWPARLTVNMELAGAPTERELQTLRCLSHGMTPEMVADALCISPWTVASHTRKIRYRLGAKTTLHACCLAIRQGLIA